MRTVAACAALAFVLASCSGGAATMDGIMHSWEGAPLDAVIAQWGYPDQEQEIAGHKLYRCITPRPPLCQRRLPAP